MIDHHAPIGEMVKVIHPSEYVADVVGRLVSIDATGFVLLSGGFFQDYQWSVLRARNMRLRLVEL